MPEPGLASLAAVAAEAAVGAPLTIESRSSAMIMRAAAGSGSERGAGGSGARQSGSGFAGESPCSGRESHEVMDEMRRWRPKLCVSLAGRVAWVVG